MMHSQAMLLQDAAFVVLPTFRADADNPGDVLVIVEDSDFYVHRDLLWFSSSFFRDLLRENWAEGHLADAANDHAAHTAAAAAAGAGAGAGEDTADAEHADSSNGLADAGPSTTAAGTDSKVATSAATAANDPLTATAVISATNEADSGAPVEELKTAAAAPEDTTFTLSDAQPSKENKRTSYHTARLTFDEASPRGPSPVPEASPTPANKMAASASSSRLPPSKCIDASLLSPSSRSENLPTRDVDASVAVSPTLSLQNLQMLETPPGSPRSKMLASLSRSTDGFAGAAAISPDRAPTAHAPPPPPPTTHVQRHRPISKPRGMIVTVLRLEEEHPSTFQSFLCAVYPHLRLGVSWRNIGLLMSFSDKYGVNPALLYDPCRSFLEASLTGNPIEAMRLAEHFGLQGVFKEASKHVLDLYAVWSTTELSVLSKETLIKLERKRSWFLERLLKFSVANPQRDYECHAGCPNPDTCAELLQARWTTAYNAAFRFGPPQPTVVWKHLRELEGGGPPLVHSACETACRTWVQTRFDRMFELGLAGPRARSHFLYILLDDSVLVKKAIRRRIRADQLPTPAPGAGGSSLPLTTTGAALVAAGVGSNGFHAGDAAGGTMGPGQGQGQNLSLGLRSMGISGSLLDLSNPL
ncbi:hypothetical protein OC834_006235 [Tilletia horrida]|nr:hypothetical protein OC834_006235 [Tilletia horrida]